MFLFHEFTDGQRKQRQNAKMLYQSYLDALQSYHLDFRYKMVWHKHKDGYELLAKQHLKTSKRKYLGRRSKETERIVEDFTKAKARIKERLSILKKKMIKEEKLNKLEGIVRAPNELVAIFRKINELGLDDKLIAIGTNSLYAYEARSAVAIEQEHLATRDIDLLNRKEKGISLIFKELMPTSKAIDFLNTIDDSFTKAKGFPYRFINKEGVWIELINPVSDSIKREGFGDNLFSDVVPLAMNGMHWLENSRLFKETVIGDNGKCANITTINPLEYAIYKNWLGKQEDRDYEKHTRDLQQSKLVTKLIIDHMPDIDIESDLGRMRHFKKEIVDAYRTEVYERIVEKME